MADGLGVAASVGNLLVLLPSLMLLLMLLLAVATDASRHFNYIRLLWPTSQLC